MLVAKESEEKLAVGKLEPPRLENTLFLLSLFSLVHCFFPAESRAGPRSGATSSCFSFFHLVIFLSFSYSMSIFSVCPPITVPSLYLLLAAVSFSVTSNDLHTFSIAVSSLFTFHLPILTLLRPFWGFVSFVCLVFFLF